MERDFLGLGSKNSPIAVKEETSDSSKDSAPSRGLGMQWSFPGRVSAAPQFLSFKPSQEDRPRKANNDRLVTSGFIPTSSADRFDPNQNPIYSSVQSVAPLDVYTTRCSQDLRVIPSANQPHQMMSVSMSVPPLVSGGKNFAGQSVNPLPLTGAPIMAPPVSVLPAPSSVVGSTDIRYASKPAGAPAQLTIFYAGSVCVYDDISPEKAQAIMLLAGNGSAVPQNKMLPAAKVQSPVPRSPAYIGSNSRASTPCSALPSPMPTISHITSQSGASSTGANLHPIVKTIGGLSSPCTQREPPKVGCSVGPVATNMIPAVALPQARKASLARFLEKRKERVLSASPYNITDKFDCRAPSEALSSSIASASSSHLPTSNLW